jgi:hypothetical protein
MNEAIKNKLCPVCKSMPLGIQNELLFCRGCGVYVCDEKKYERFATSHLAYVAFKKPLSLYGIHHKTDNARWYATAFTAWFAGAMAIIIFSPTLALF